MFHLFFRPNNIVGMLQICHDDFFSGLFYCGTLKTDAAKVCVLIDINQKRTLSSPEIVFKS